MDYYGIGFSNIRLPNSSKSYMYKYDARINLFPEEVFLHEFLHSLERNLSEYGYSLLMARIMFPTIIFDNLEDDDYLYNFDISKYISYLKDVYYIIKNRSNIDVIDWLER